MQSDYENLNQTYNNDNQIIDTTVSSINDDRMIIKENNSTELAMVSDTKDDMNLMKIEKDNFLDNNNNDLEIGNQNFRVERIISRRRFGKTYPFFFNKGEPMIVIGPDWPYFLFLSSFTTIMLFIFYKTFDNKISNWVKLLGFFIYLLHIISYIYTVFKNPGIPSQEMELENSDLKEVLKGIKNYRICKVCNVIMNRSKETNHCDDCGVCIEGLDHHCVWTTKCVGKGNIKSFYAFIVTSIILMVNIIITIFCAEN